MKIKIVALLLMLSAVSNLKISAQQTWPLYPGAIPNSKNCPDKEISETTGRKVVRNVTIPTLTVFLPKKQNAAKLAIIICPGGGYSNLSIQDGGFEAAQKLAEYGIVAFVLKYRTSDVLCNSNNTIVPLQDLQQAIFYVKSNSAKWKIDTDKVGLLGFSAGGHLSALAATQFRDPQIDAKGISLRPAFTILAYPVISFTEALTSKKTKTRENLLGSSPSLDQIKWFSPEQNVVADTPPAFLLHASDDSTALVGNSINYYNALHKFNIPVKMIIYQKGGHGFATYNQQENDNWLGTAVAWLKLNSFLK